MLLFISLACEDSEINFPPTFYVLDGALCHDYMNNICKNDH